MTVVVTKASNYHWYGIRVLNTMEDVQRFIKECQHRVVIEKNRYTDNKIFKYWDGMKAEDIPIIKECPLHITIYDDYIE